MKKELLFVGLAVTMGLTAIAQNSRQVMLAPEFKSALKAESKIDVDGPNSATAKTLYTPRAIKSNTNARSAAVSRTKISSSQNMFTALVSESNCLTANQDLNTVMFTARMNPDLPGGAGKSGYIQCTFSTNGGATFNKSVIVNNNNTVFARYPSGGIVNPVGNTNPNMAFAAVAGPMTDNSQWVANYFSSMRLDSTNNKQNTLTATQGSAYWYMPRYGFQATDDARAHVLGVNYNPYAFPSLINGFVIHNGALNTTTNQVDWSSVEIKHAFATYPTDTDQLISNFGSIAFSQDGSVGYFVVIARDSANDQRAPQPIVFKSTDGGNTWNFFSAYNYGNIASATEVLPTTNAGTFKPYWSSNEGFDLAVDKNNNLHILCAVYGSSSEDPDSLNFGYFNLHQIFDTYHDGFQWHMMKVADLYKGRVPNASSPWGAAGGWGSRMQIAKTKDGSKLFYVWMDTDTTLSTTYNELPDIIGRGYDVDTKLCTPVVNFTANTALYAQNFWMYVSNIALTSGLTYSIPVTETESRTPGDDGSNPVDHYYVSGIQFDNTQFTSLQMDSADYVGIERTTRSSFSKNFSVAQNYPNPFSNETSIVVSLDKASDVTLTVFNAVGQKVTEKRQSGAAGTASFRINKAELGAGLFFYTVRAGENVVTKKMIVQ
jgi:hypothetical protein